MLPDLKARCSDCCKQFTDREGVKSCSNCHLVRYCSRECQRRAWPEHKKMCNSDLQDIKRRDPQGKVSRLNDKFTKFTNAWRDSLSCFAMWALNSANHPIGHLQHNIFVIIFEEKENPESHLDSFYVVEGDIRKRSDVAKTMLEVGVRPDIVQKWKTDLRDPETLQMVLVGSLCKPMCTGGRDPATGRSVNPLRGIDARTADALEKWWYPCFHDAVFIGQPWHTANYPQYVSSKENLNMKTIYQLHMRSAAFDVLEKANMEHRQEQGKSNFRWFPEDGDPPAELIALDNVVRPLSKGQKKNKRKKAKKAVNQILSQEELGEHLPAPVSQIGVGDLK